MNDIAKAPWFSGWAGALEQRWFESDVLRDNPLGDSARRPIWIYTPPGYDTTQDRYPTVYLIQGYTGHLDRWQNRGAFAQSLPETIDRNMADGTFPPCVVVYVDAFSSLGGAQFIDSPGVGNYLTYLHDEVVPWVDNEYRTHASRDHRVIAGHSSGGYGAIVSAMLRPDTWGGFADFAGDAQFETCYIPLFREVVRSLRDEYEGSYDRFFESYRSRRPLSKGSDINNVMIWCMAACWSSDSDGTIHLPFDVGTGALVPEIWQRWLDWDPVRMIPKHADALRSMKAVWVDAGKSDEFYLDLGAGAVRRELEAIGVNAQFELFDGRHGGNDYRFPDAIRYVVEQLG